MTDPELQNVIHVRSLKVARQYLAPNTRLEVDACIRNSLPIPTALYKVVKAALDKHERKMNVR